jgi:hypothetical protein
MGENIPNGHKIYQTAIKLTKWPYNLPTSFIARPSKIYLNWNFGFKIYIPPGNPVVKPFQSPFVAKAG